MSSKVQPFIPALVVLALVFAAYAAPSLKAVRLSGTYTVAVFGPECIRDIQKTPFTHAEAPYSEDSGVDMAHVHVYGLDAKIRQSCARLEVRHK